MSNLRCYVVKFATSCGKECDKGVRLRIELFRKFAKRKIGDLLLIEFVFITPLLVMYIFAKIMQAMKRLFPVFLLLVICTICVTANAQSDYYIRQAESYMREAEYYNKQAAGYERDAEYYNKQAQGYLRDVDYYTRQHDYDKASTRTRWAKEATEKAQTRMKWAAEAREKARTRNKWAQEAMEKARQSQY